MNEPAVLVVHCVDTEGPLGGDARRLPDGSAEFFADWNDIEQSLAELTASGFRRDHADSFGRPYRFDWFILDFTGFRTNPKQRVAAYHDTWDHLKGLPTDIDGFSWHYHVPPRSGIGDAWSDTWLSSNEANVILARRLLERDAFPAAFRAGGTIEDEPASRWLEQVFPIDFSNRVSERSRPNADLYSFDWFGAPQIWGSYHPSYFDVRRAGSMRRFVYRSIDLRSRYNELTQAHVDACFREVDASRTPKVLSFFSHDNRDMRPETYHVIELLREAERRLGVPWASCTAVEAHRLHNGFPNNEPIALQLESTRHGFHIQCEGEQPFQRTPFVAAELHDGRFVRLYAKQHSELSWHVACDPTLVRRVGAAVTSTGGAVSLASTHIG